MILYNANLENHPTSSGSLNSIINGNWNNIDGWFSPSQGLTASQATTVVTASAAVFTADDEGATIRFADGTTRVIAAGGFTNSTTVTVTVSGTVASQSFKLYRTDQVANDNLMRGLTKRVRMLAGDDGKLWMWNAATQRLVPVTVAVIDEAGGTLTIADAKNVVLGTGTGTQIGTAVGQKIAFHGSAAVAQRAGAAQAAVSLDADVTGADTVDKAAVDANFAAIQTLLNELRAALVEKGLIKGAA
jgi:hypothetical protein